MCGQSELARSLAQSFEGWQGGGIFHFSKTSGSQKKNHDGYGVIEADFFFWLACQIFIV